MDYISKYESDEESVEEDSGVYISISDLMSGLLMIFALLFIAVQAQLYQEFQKSQALKIELTRYKKAVDEMPIIILDALSGKFGESGLFSVDPQTGDVSIGDRILFDEGSDKLKPEGEQFLAKFIPAYSSIIFSDNMFDRQILRVVIEGHTSSRGTERENMELSLRRALSVSEYIFSDKVSFATKEQFKNKILASGRGEIDADRTTDSASDRKVTFRFQFRREDFGKFLDRSNNLPNNGESE